MSGDVAEGGRIVYGMDMHGKNAGDDVIRAAAVIDAHGDGDVAVLIELRVECEYAGGRAVGKVEGRVGKDGGIGRGGTVL